MNAFESYFDVDHREQAKRKQQNCLLENRSCRTLRRQGFGGQARLRSPLPQQAGQTKQTICRGISSFAVGMVLGWMAGTITYCMIHIITK